MNAGIVASGLPYKWRWFAITRSNQAAWAFDRLRLYTPKWHTKVAVFKNVSSYATNTGEVFNGELVDIQPFNSVGDFEHDFTFDLSFNINNDRLYICITGIPENAKFSQVYAYPTGYSGTRGKNAELEEWHFNMINPEVGADTSGNAYLRFENQTIKNLVIPSYIRASNINLQNNNLQSEGIDEVLISLDNYGLSNGNLDYSNNSGNPTVASRSAYDSLISKGWTITGTAPPTA